MYSDGVIVRVVMVNSYTVKPATVIRKYVKEGLLFAKPMLIIDGYEFQVPWRTYTEANEGDKTALSYYDNNVVKFGKIRGRRL